MGACLPYDYFDSRVIKTLTRIFKGAIHLFDNGKNNFSPVSLALAQADRWQEILHDKRSADNAIHFISVIG